MSTINPTESEQIMTAPTTAAFRSQRATLALLEQIDATPASDLAALRAQIAALPTPRTSTNTSVNHAGRKRAVLHHIDSLLAQPAMNPTAEGFSTSPWL